MVSTDLFVGLQGQAAFPAASSGARYAHRDGLPPLGHLDYLRLGGSLPLWGKLRLLIHAVPDH
jgi:hypothetical protein